MDFLAHIQKQIPIVQTYGLSIEEFSSNKVVLNVPLAKHINHVGTAFGGSLYAICALACYGWVWAALEESNFKTNNVVIVSGHIKYPRPTKKDFKVVCALDNPDQLKQFVAELKSKQKVRVKLTSRIFVDTDVTAEFHGIYQARI